MQFFFQLCNFLMLFYYIQMGAPTSTRSFTDEWRILRNFPLLLVSLYISGHPLASSHRFLFSYYLNIKFPKGFVPSSPLNYTVCLDSLIHVQSPPSPPTIMLTSVPNPILPPAPPLPPPVSAHLLASILQSWKRTWSVDKPKLIKTPFLPPLQICSSHWLSCPSYIYNQNSMSLKFLLPLFKNNALQE